MEPARDHVDREALIAAILQFLGSQDLLTTADIRAALAQEVTSAGPEALVALRSRLTADSGWDYYPPDPLARRIHHLLAWRFLQTDSIVAGTEHLGRVAEVPLALVANHLSYADANVIEVLLQRSGAIAIADRLTALAGPKVFTSRERRFSSLCFGTVKVPQSTGVSSEEAILNAREVARAARRAIDVAHGRLRSGDVLLLFAEGTRSRSAAMQRMLAGAARYLELPATTVLPIGLAGSEALFPVGASGLQPSRVVMRIGPPLSAKQLFAQAAGDRHVVMDAIGLAIADLLPASYHGVYANQERFSSAAHALGVARVAGAVS